MCKSNKKVDEKTTFKISAGILVYQDKKVIISKLQFYLQFIVYICLLV